MSNDFETDGFNAAIEDLKLATISGERIIDLANSSITETAAVESYASDVSGTYSKSDCSYIIQCSRLI